METVVVLLAGGESRRLGRDKLTVPLGSSTVLGHLLDGVREVLPQLPVVLVGPPREVPGDGVIQVREEPPGGGPVAALACALRTSVASSARLIGVLAGDQPFAAPALAYLLARRASLDDGVALLPPHALLAVDPNGHRQALLGLYRADSLRAAVGTDPAGRSMRSVLDRLRVAELAVPATWTLDVDTPADVQVVRRVAASAAEPPPAPAAPRR